MTREEAIIILDEVIPPPEHHTVDLDHLRIAQAWLCIKETLTAEPIKHGQWIWRGGNLYECSECGAIVVAQDYIPIELHYFCRGCGADMRSTMSQVKPNNAVKEAKMDEVEE